MSLSEFDFLDVGQLEENDSCDQQSVAKQRGRASFEEERTVEEFDQDAPATFDRNRMRDLLGLGLTSDGTAARPQ